jgi:hypothetical protein
LIRQAIEGMPEGKVLEPLGPLPAWQPSFGLVEGWRGAIIYWLMVDNKGMLYRVKVKDPSFVNRRPLKFALLENIVPDFPLVNKSFNLSYSGNNLQIIPGLIENWTDSQPCRCKSATRRTATPVSGRLLVPRFKSQSMTPDCAIVG